jgi:hypothetical protein
MHFLKKVHQKLLFSGAVWGYDRRACKVFAIKWKIKIKKA